MTTKLMNNSVDNTVVLPGFEDLLLKADLNSSGSNEHVTGSGENKQAQRRKEKCGAKCFHARGVDCDCVCRGVNHGKGLMA